MKTAVIYARFSCERQTEQSIEGQLSVCNEYAIANGITIVGTYIDRAVSGRTDDRPDFQKMLADSKTAGWDYVIVYKGDRFARNRYDSAINKNILKNNGVRVLSATENIPDTPEGIVLEAILEGYAEYYSAELAQKIRRGMTESRKKGYFVGGKGLYGYDVVDRRMVINEKEAEIVRKIFSLFANGTPVTEIHKWLMDNAVTHKKGQPFPIGSVYRMLHLEQYIGIYRHGEEVYTETFPAIVDKETWDRVQAILAKKKRDKTRQRVTQYLLSGKVYCGECGERMQGESGAGRHGEMHYYYRCKTAKRHRGGCTLRAIKKGELEDLVYYACCDVLDGGAINSLAEKIYAIVTEGAEKNQVLDRLKERLEERKKARDNIYAAIEKGIVTDGLLARVKGIEDEIADIMQQMAEEERKSKMKFSKDDFVSFLSSLTEEQASNPEFKKQIISALVRSVTVYKDKVCITFYYTPNGGKDHYSTDFEVSEDQIADSTLDSFCPPIGLNPNPVVFCTLQFWGIWIKRTTR